MHNPSSQPTFVSLGPADVQATMRIVAAGQKNPWSREMVAVELNHNHGFHFGAIAQKSNELCSYIFCRLFLEELNIHHLCTHPEFRRKGYAITLLEHAFSNARLNGAKKALLEVAASNTAAVALYKKAGFSTDYIRKKYYSDGDDALVMSRLL